MPRTYHRICFALFLAIAAVGCRSNTDAADPAPPPPDEAAPAAPTEYRATIRWTSHGIAHVEAADLASLTFGQGYAFASLHVCVLADQIVKIRSQRARYFGPGKNDANIDSDFGHMATGAYDRARREWPNQSDDARQVVRGFAAGYNKYLADVGPDGLPAECAGADWVGPIEDIDVVAYGVQTMMIGSSGYFVDNIGAAQPPGDSANRKGAMYDAHRSDSPASNGWALGANKTTTGRGMLVANPHFPWEGALRFYETHLTIPGKLDAYGVNLLGLPLISIGFNENLAWTHTFSSSTRFVIYRLTLDGDATHYKYGTETRELEAKVRTIQVKQADGKLAEVSRTLYRSHYGPILSGPSLPWTNGTAFSIRDVAGGTQSLDQYLAMMRAANLDEFKKAFENYQATPFVNTMYADRDGNAWYIDGSSVPDMTAAAIAAWRFGLKSIPELKAAWDRGVVVLDGSMPLFELQTDPQSAIPGAISYERAPQLTRRDYVMNANDPYWITNPDEPLAGFSLLYGEDDAAPSQRTRMNHRLIRENGTFSREDLRGAILSNRALTAALLREPVVARCRKLGNKLRKACDVLDAWDSRYDLDRKGALLWRELIAAYPEPLWAKPFDRSRPLETPSGLAPAPAGAKDPLESALLTAIDRLERAKLDPYETTVGDAQFTEKGGKRIPVHGSGGRVGITNPVYYTSRNSTMLSKMSGGAPINPQTGLSDRGYPVNYGTSFLMVVGFEDDGPHADAIMTYSQSSDPKSPYFADQTEMYARKQWRPVLFTQDQIRSDSQLKVQKLTAPVPQPAAAR